MLAPYDYMGRPSQTSYLSSSIGGIEIAGELLIFRIIRQKFLDRKRPFVYSRFAHYILLIIRLLFIFLRSM